jgi:hypothetical protein
MKRSIYRALFFAVILVAVTAVLRAQHVAYPNGKAPEIIAGPEVGFRVDHYNGNVPVGELVVQRDGKWVPVEFAATVKPMR